MAKIRLGNGDDSMGKIRAYKSWEEGYGEGSVQGGIECDAKSVVRIGN